MKKILLVLLCLSLTLPAFAATSTTNYSFSKPAVNDPIDEDIWGDLLNTNWDTLDSKLKTASDWVKLNKTSGYTVLTTDRNKVILGDATSAAFTLTLPAASSAGDGFALIVKKTDSSANAVTLDGNSSETIDGATTYALSSQYDAVLIVCDGSNWHVASKAQTVSAASTSAAGIVELLTAAELLTGTDTTRAATADSFTSNASIAANGYYKLPGGLILQWGTNTSGSANNLAITLPTAFASACYSGGLNTIGATSRAVAVISCTTTTLTVARYNSSTGANTTDNIFWWAVGK